MIWRARATTAFGLLLAATKNRSFTRVVQLSALGLPSLVSCTDDKNEDFITKMKRQAEKATNQQGNDVLIALSEQINKAVETGVPGQISWGFVSGFSAGFCIKKVSKIAAFVFGGIFIFIQTLSYNGYIDVNYQKVESELMQWADLNHDGVVDQKDAKVAYDQLLKVLSFHLPAGGGFGTGLIMGLRTA